MNNFLSIFRNTKRVLDSRFLSIRLTADGKEIPKKKYLENRITLIDSDNSISITDLKSAQNLSNKRELKLVKIQDEDSKTRRPVYKLISNADYHEEELQRRKEKQTSRQNSEIKGNKLVTISSRIGEHDLMTSVKKMAKHLEKQYEVKVIVTGDGTDAVQKSERIYSVVESYVKAVGKIVQKRITGNHLKFQLLPLKESSSHAPSNPSQTNQDKKDQGPL